MTLEEIYAKLKKYHSKTWIKQLVFCLENADLSVSVRRPTKSFNNFEQKY